MPQRGEEPGTPPEGGFGRSLLELLVAAPPNVLGEPSGYREAAVLVPVLATRQLLFTLRSRDLSHHQGQVSFPGGAKEAGETLEETALRETHEEIGLPHERIELIGPLNQVFSPAGFIVQPFVAWVETPGRLFANLEEVEQLLYISLDDLLHAGAWIEERSYTLGVRRVWHYPYRDLDIWGVTGNILHDFLLRYRGLVYSDLRESSR